MTASPRRSARSHPRRVASASLVLAALAGCAVGPDFQPPAAPAVSGYTKQPLPAATASAEDPAGAAQHFEPGQDIPGQWWTLFKSPALSQLVEEALKANPDLAAAQAALRVAQQTVKAQQAAFFPTVGGTFTPQRQKNAVEPSATLQVPTPYFNLYTAQLSVGYTPDIFGGVRRQVEGAEAQAEQQRYELEATYLTLTANLVTAAITEASLRAQIAATEKIITAERQSLALLRKQRALGQAAGVDVAGQEALLAQAEATLPPLRKQLDQERDLLTALAGRLPSDEIEAEFDLAQFELPTDLPVTLPSKLIEQRPDVAAASANLHAATAAVGVAIADFLPQLSLSAGTGTTATQIGQLFQPGNGFWSLGASLSQTLFDGGALLYKRRAADAALDEAGAQYRSTVITAFQNVADSLKALSADAEALKANVAAERAAAANLAYTRRQLDLGAVASLALLTAQQTYQQAVIALVQAKANRYSDTAALFQSLGGGWWNRTDVAPVQTAAVEPKP